MEKHPKPAENEKQAKHPLDKPEPSPSRQSKRRQTISLACTACQKRKSKCDGGKPSCSSCQRKATECTYAESDLRRNINLRHLNQKLSMQVRDYESLIESLKKSSDVDAHEYLQALRTVDRVKDAMDLIRIGQGIQEQGPEQVQGAGTDNDLKGASGQASTNRNLDLTPHDTQDWDDRWPVILPGDPLDMADRTSAGSSVLGGSDEDFGFDPISWGMPRKSFGSQASLSPTTSSFAREPWAPGLISSSQIFQPDGCIAVYQNKHIHNTFIPLYLIQPLGLLDDEPLSRTYHSFCVYNRRALRLGKPFKEVLGEECVDLGTLLAPNGMQDAHPFSQWAARLLMTMPLCDLTKLACMHAVHRLMQWQVRPTAGSYARIPENMKPTMGQRLVPHPIWIDYIFSPTIRDLFLNNPSNIRADWVAAFPDAQIKWSRSVRDTVYLNPATNRLNLCLDFELHISNFENWILPSEAYVILPR